jgi:uncharacterized protein RhaS with RHS repeats
VPIPYAQAGDPQSLNLYAYVRNNPITQVDPDGHVQCIGYWCTLNGSGQTEHEKELAMTEAQQKAVDILKAINSLMEDPVVQAATYQLFNNSGFGFRPGEERSMWVILQDGKVNIVPWEPTHEGHHDTWNGLPPKGAVAQIHTHADHTETGASLNAKPSVKDHRLADNADHNGFRGPVFTVSHSGIYRADPGVNDPIQIRDSSWIKEFEPKEQK